jgi:hypothetical protein
MTGGLPDNDPAIDLVEKHIAFGRDRKALRWIKSLEIAPFIGRKVDLLELKD